MDPKIIKRLHFPYQLVSYQVVRTNNKYKIDQKIEENWTRSDTVRAYVEISLAFRLEKAALWKTAKIGLDQSTRGAQMFFFSASYFGQAAAG